MIGTTLSHFKITAKLGEGGMGEVYRAEDTKLGREVAIKVLPDAVASDPERLGRFEREARVLAALNHPNIAAIHQVEQADGVHFLVMELAQGQTLKDRIARGAVPQGEAAAMALQIAEALEAAHDQGIVHRDLKPANVAVDTGGKVKVLDFGLAKALEEDSSSMVASALSISPTLSAQMTGAGIILGTAAYMAPEQARGQAVDRRADIWAFGCVLYEMLTGAPTYGGETITDILGAIVHKEPAWDTLPANLAPPLRRLLERCLEKDPKRRLQAIGEARLALADYLADPQGFEEEPPEVAAVAPRLPLWQRLLPWAVAAALALALGTVPLWRPRDTTVVRAAIPPPEGQLFHLGSFDPGPVAVSPDGTRLAFSARSEEGQILLYVRPLDAAQAHVLSGTEGAQYPFWSPDSRWIGFFTKGDETLKKINATGGPPMTLAPATDGKGGSWSPEGVILFAPGPATPLHRVAAAGGEATPITEIDSERFNSHRHPRFLPDGRHFLFVARAPSTEQSALMVGSLDGDEPPRELTKSSTQAEYASGRLLFVRERTLMAQPFDPKGQELVGEAVPIAEELIEYRGASISVFSASANGVLTYQTGQSSSGVGLQWLDRKGLQVSTLGDPADYRTVVLSPDGRYAMASITDQESGNHDLWLFEVERNLRTRFTFEPDNEWIAAWMPDSESVIYTTAGEGKTRFLRKEVGRSAEPELVLEIEGEQAMATSISPDGRSLAYSASTEDTDVDLWVLPLDGSGEPEIFRQSEFREVFSVFSPDGRWLAYISDESGQFEIYVEPFPGPGRRWRVSTDGGVYPFWRSDGRELLYHEFDGQVMTTSVEPQEGALRVGQPEVLFQIDSPSAGGAIFAPSPDAETFLVVPTESQEADTLLNLVVNWPEILVEQ